ncbi:MAG: methylmalonyl-CoA mutase small subunit [Rikenellaceae bacterium]|nr:methylmalonyl-CoA mutase small subunit [Rikenellaceae bacterium]
MANTEKAKLFAEFPPVSTEQWEAVITTDLKGADYERKLVWRTAEGFNVRPYYRAENLEGIDFLGTEAGEFPYVRGTHNSNDWAIHQTVSVKCPKAANEEALKLLNSGINSLGFCFCAADEVTAETIDTLLEGICIPAVELTFCGKNFVPTADLIMAKVESLGLAKDEVKINFIFDPIVKDLSTKGIYCCGNTEGTECYEAVAAMIKRTADYKYIRVVNVSGATFSNAGSTIVEELAFSLAAGHDYLVKLTEMGLPIDLVARKVRFTFAVTSNYFMEIAKFRAARMLWANIVKGYNPEKQCSCKMFAHAVTSTWNQTAYDPYVNMLRGTTEAMSATLAGVHSLEVLPFDYAFEQPTEFSKRIARNVELLLKHESHFDQVVDPAGGSYYIENLTKNIAEQAWKLFLEVEDKGGYVEAYKAGFIVERVKASAAAKDKNIATRRQILLGANQYPNFTEVADAAVVAETVTRPEAEGNVLTPYRGAMAFEAMRLGVDRSGKEPKAFMLTCGNLAMARARAQFSCNFFACAGIRVQDNTFFHSVEEGVAAALEAKADIVVVCASDDDYAEVAPKVKELLAGKAILVVAGAPACAPELEAQGISNFINVKSNVLETLKFYLKELGI